MVKVFILTVRDILGWNKSYENSKNRVGRSIIYFFFLKGTRETGLMNHKYKSETLKDPIPMDRPRRKDFFLREKWRIDWSRLENTLLSGELYWGYGSAQNAQNADHWIADANHLRTLPSLNFLIGDIPPNHIRKNYDSCTCHRLTYLLLFSSIVYVQHICTSLTQKKGYRFRTGYEPNFHI